jgi:thiol:disulfide interchange protein DsbC
MFKKITLTFITCLTLVLAIQSVSESTNQVEEEIATTIIAKLKTARPDLDYEVLADSPIADLYKVQVVGGPVLYTTASGEYFLDGELYRVSPGRFVNLSEQEMSSVRRELIGAIDLGEMIVFSPEGELKSVINVFTDVDCGYCRKLHNDVPELNSRGIEVRYLAFPRAGIGSSSYDKMVSAWCADNPGEALTRLKNGDVIKSRQCLENPVAAHYQLGQKIGINGTPAIIFADGTLMPGYRPAADMARILGVN